MSHNKYLVCCKNELVKGISLNTGTYTGIAFLLDTFSTIVENILTVLDNSLITTTSKSKVNSCSCVFVALSIGTGMKSDTYTYGDMGVFITNCNITYTVQYIKFGFLNTFKIFLLENEEISVILHFSVYSVQLLEAFCNFTFN